MTSLVNRPWLPSVLIGVGATALITTFAGAASSAGWSPWTALGRLAPEALPVGAAHAGVVVPHATFVPVSDSCVTCGVVQAVRAVQVRGAAAEPGQPVPLSYRITVRMDDGSYRTLAQKTAPSLGVGDRVQVLEGTVVARR